MVEKKSGRQRVAVQLDASLAERLETERARMQGVLDESGRIAGYDSDRKVSMSDAVRSLLRRALA